MMTYMIMEVHDNEDVHDNRPNNVTELLHEIDRLSCNMLTDATAYHHLIHLENGNSSHD